MRKKAPWTDVNGKEILEGDMVVNEYKEICRVEHYAHFTLGKWRLVLDDGSSYDMRSHCAKDKKIELMEYN